MQRLWYDDFQRPYAGELPASSGVCDKAALQERRMHGKSKGIQNPHIHKALDHVYQQLQPKPKDHDARWAMLQLLNNALNRLMPGVLIHAFGSYIIDVFTSESDLDLSMEITAGGHGKSRADKVYYLRKLTILLHQIKRDTGAVCKIEPVFRAKVPIVKFVDSKTLLECDVSVENNDGIAKSKFLRVVSSIDPRFRQLCFLVKAWARAHQINNPREGSLSSFAIVLLLAFHLQTRSPPIFPPFSTLLTGFLSLNSAAFFWELENRVKHLKNQRYGWSNKETAAELFYSFFLKLYSVRDLWKHGLCASTYTGSWIYKPEAVGGTIFVEDFVTLDHNAARSLNAQEFDIVTECIEAALSQLEAASLTMQQLTSSLFGNNITRSIPTVAPVEVVPRARNVPIISLSHVQVVPRARNVPIVSVPHVQVVPRSNWRGFELGR